MQNGKSSNSDEISFTSPRNFLLIRFVSDSSTAQRRGDYDYPAPEEQHVYDVTHEHVQALDDHHDHHDLHDHHHDHHDHHDPGYWKKKMIWKKGWKKIWKPAKKQIWKPHWKKIWKPIWVPTQKPAWKEIQVPDWKKVWKPVWKHIQVPAWKEIQVPDWKKIWKPVWKPIQVPAWKEIQVPAWKKVWKPVWKEIQVPAWKEIQVPAWKQLWVGTSTIACSFSPLIPVNLSTNLGLKQPASTCGCASGRLSGRLIGSCPLVQYVASFPPLKKWYWCIYRRLA